MKLTIENITPYLCYGLKFATPSGRISGLEFNDNGLQIAKRAFDMASMSYRSISFSNALRDNKPVLRPMNLTKPIKIDGVEIVPLIELYKLSNETNYNKELDYEFVESWGAGKILKVFKDRTKDIYTEFIHFNGSFRKDTRYCAGSDAFGFNLDTPIRCNDKIHNQLQLFQWLYKNKFDLSGLIDAGLAVDASTLDINPYDN